MKAARALAIEALSWSDEGRLSVIYETITGRVPDGQELEILQKAQSDFEAFYREHPELAATFANEAIDGKYTPEAIAAWSMIINTLYNLDITKTRS